MNQRKVNLFMVGAAKCGTTTIHKILAQHPDIYAGPIKEPHYFVRDEFQPHPEYRKRIALTEEKYIQNYSKAGSQKYLIDSSINYLYFENSANSIKAYNPDAKIIIVLRHPVDRLYSHYKMLRKDGVVKSSLEQFLDHPYDNNHMNLMRQGFYSTGIKNYLKAFGKDNVLILTFGILKNQALLKEKLTNFLSIAAFKNEAVEHENTGGMPKNEFLRYLHIDFVLTRFLKRIIPKSKFRSMIGSWIMSHFYTPSKMNTETRDKLEAYYKEEVTLLKSMEITFEK
jgi:hypothetical protein